MKRVRRDAGTWRTRVAARWIIVFGLILTPAASLGVVKGDVNEDGVVDLDDMLALTQAVGIRFGVTVDPDLADVAPMQPNGVSGDGTVGIGDVVLMYQALRGGYDVDGDGLFTPDENAIGTSPFLADTDGDGHPDSNDPNPLVVDPPSNPDLHVEDGPNSVTLSWATPAGQVGSYLIHRYGTDGEYTYFTADGSAQSFVDSTAQTGKVYFYWVQAIHPTGLQSAFVNCDISDPNNNTLWRSGARGPLPNPSFSASESAGTGAFVDWDLITSVAVDEYRIYKSTTAVPLGSTSASFTLAYTQSSTANLPSNTTLSLSPGTYYFRMTSRTGATESNLASAQQRVVVVH